MFKNFIKNPNPKQVGHPELQQFFEFWRELKKQFQYPSRKNFKPKDIIHHLPFVSLFDCETEPQRFRCRLIGTRLLDSFKSDPTGQYFDEMEHSEGMIERYEWLVENKLPYYTYQKKVIWNGMNFKNYGFIACPLFDENKSVNMILGRSFHEKVFTSLK